MKRAGRWLAGVWLLLLLLKFPANYALDSFGLAGAIIAHVLVFVLYAGGLYLLYRALTVPPAAKPSP